MKWLVLLFFISAAYAKIIIEKWEMQIDSSYADVKYGIKDKTHLYVNAHALKEADDVVIDAAVYSKVDGNFNSLVNVPKIHVCTVHEHEDPLIKFIHDEIVQYGNLTKACPVLKDSYYYLNDFTVDEAKFPMSMPTGEFRIDTNASALEGGKLNHIASSEIYFKIE